MTPNPLSVSSPSTQLQQRLTIASLLAVGAFFVLGYRLFTKSVLEHAHYATLASNQHTIREDLPSHRGVIYAHDGPTTLFPIALNERRYDVSVIPNRVTDPKGLAGALSAILELDSGELLEKIDNDKPYLPPLKRRVDRSTVDHVIALPYRGISVTPVDARLYPEGEFASQLLGFVNAENVGSYGVESRYNELLLGKSGSLLGRKDTFGRLVSITGSVAPEPGSSLVLTVDRTIQYLAEQALREGVEQYGAGGGSVVVLQPKTGAIIALANQPSYDPNHFNEVPQTEQHRYLDAAISTVYEPGSVMKPVIMAMAINEGKLQPDTKETFGKSVVVQGYEINTALDKAYGEETMTQVLENSDNVGMVWVAGHLEYQTMYDYFKRFGFDGPTGVDLPGETSGSIVPLKEWRDINRATMAFGQGISATPLQMANAWATVINGGKLMQPFVVQSIVRASGERVETRPTELREVISTETSDKLRGMLQSVVDKGQSKKGAIGGYAIGGKTGTAQIAKASGGGYEEEQWNHTFMGFFPVDDPQYLVLVKLDRPTASRYADGTAVPTFSKIARGIISYTELQPTREP